MTINARLIFLLLRVTVVGCTVYEIQLGVFSLLGRLSSDIVTVASVIK